MGVVPGGAGGADFDRSVNPISTRGTDYANLITNGTPGFSDLPTALYVDLMQEGGNCSICSRKKVQFTGGKSHQLHLVSIFY